MKTYLITLSVLLLGMVSEVRGDFIPKPLQCRWILMSKLVKLNVHDGFFVIDNLDRVMVLETSNTKKYGKSVTLLINLRGKKNDYFSHCLSEGNSVYFVFSKDNLDLPVNITFKELTSDKSVRLLFELLDPMHHN